MGLKIRKKGAASAPDPATHCQLPTLFARSASTRVFQNQASPRRQSIRRSLTRKEATIIRARLCIQPIDQSWRMPASTTGKPVSPLVQARKPASFFAQAKSANAALKGRWVISGLWNSKL